MNRLRVKLYSPHVPASASPRLAVRAAHFFGEYCDHTPGAEVSVTAGVVDATGKSLPWPVSRFIPVEPAQVANDPNGLATYAALCADRSPFDVQFLPHPWQCFPAGRVSGNPAPIVCYVPDLDFDDTDLGSVTDARRRLASLVSRDCATLVFPSEGLRERMIDRYCVPVERTVVIRPSASLMKPPPDVKAIGRKLGLPPDFVVCFEAAGRSAEEHLAETFGRRELPWPVVVLSAQPPAKRGLSDRDFDPTFGGRLIRLCNLALSDYHATLALARAAVNFTASPTPFIDTPQLDAMVLRKPVFCQAAPQGNGWAGADRAHVVLFRGAEDVCHGLKRLAEGACDGTQIDAAEAFARSRNEADLARELFESFREVFETPRTKRIRFREAQPACRERRVAWLLNHSALHAHEVPLIRSLGFEVYTPKQTPASDFRSGAVASADDEVSTLPRWVLERLNRHNFYESPLPDDLIPILNSYFGTVIVSSYAMMVREMVHKFRGRILVRAFGREHPATYAEYWGGFGGQELWDRITEIGHRFWLTPPYETIPPHEPEPLRSHSMILPLGIADRAMRNSGQWNGDREKVLFVCPSINDTPLYYGGIYRDFKYHFGDLPHLIAGSQVKPVDDPNVLGYLAEVPYRRLLNDLRVMYYHSREPRHLHYHPLEAIVQGMPVVYLTGGLMEEFGGPDQPGACETEADARRKLRRILDGDRELMQAIRAKQGKILETFGDEHVVREWREKFVGKIMSTPLTPGTRPPALWLDQPPQRIVPTAERARPPKDVKIGVYLRTVPGGGVFNYVTALVRKLSDTDVAGGGLEILLGRRSTALPFPTWPFEKDSRLRVHQLADREYLPGEPFPLKQPRHVTVPDARDLDVAPVRSEVLPEAPAMLRRRVTLRLKRILDKLREVRINHSSPLVRFGVAGLLAGLYYSRGVATQRTPLPKGTGAARILKHAIDPEPAPLTFEQIRQITARNDVTFFAYPYDLIAADTPLDEIEELPVVIVMYDLAHEFSLSWGARNYTIHREMHVWAKIARMIVFGSDSIRRDAVGRYGIPIEKTTVVTVPPLVPRQEPPSAEETASVRRKLGLPHDYILNLGYQGPHKNNVVLLEAIALLKWRSGRVPPLVLAGPDARRFVVGDLRDAYSVKLREVIKRARLVEGQDFFVLDYVAQADIAGLYGGAAVCVSVSRSEAQIHGMILEAMLYKRPLVCSDIPCNVEQLGTDDKYGLVVPADDPTALADALLDIFDRPVEAAERVARAQTWIKGLRWEPVLDEYRRIFNVTAAPMAEPATAARVEQEDLIAA